MVNKSPISYKQSGVNIDLSNVLINNIKNIAKKTHRPEVLNNIGGFNALCELPKKYQEPILVSSSDGIGTKLNLSIKFNSFQKIGIDLVAMCVNDIILSGAEPLFFLDYYATSNLNIQIASTIINSIAEGCLLSGCALVGGETAETPGVYQYKDCDIAGFCLGVVEKSKIIDCKNIQHNDILIALASSGLHSNGYSLVRKIIEVNNIDPMRKKINNKLLIEYLFEPTQIYANVIIKLLKKYDIHAMAHITGGGLLDNICRILSDNNEAIIYEQSWNWPSIFKWISAEAHINHQEMYSVFNCGVGMIIVINENDADKAVEFINSINNNQAWKIGVVKRSIKKSVIVQK
ncbi:MAG: phosphoribosylformylglycinamidine cyclo-ligase [Pantoea sp. Brub]|nr:phosphoribosylformylglycinamidine cyclo-ligase [Pantoea sp. Brub]